MVAPSDDPGRDQQRENHDADHVTAVALPQLQQIVAAQLFVDFAEYFAHKNPNLTAVERLASTFERQRRAKQRTKQATLDAPLEMVKITAL